MPHTLPAYIKDYLKQYMPPTHKMWWMRSELIGLEQRTVTHPSGGAPGLYFRVAVRDIDAPKDERQAYEFDIHAQTYKDFRVKDRMSLFGHEPINATHLSYPRYFYNHETTVRGACYQTHFVDRNFFPITDMVATVEGSKRDKKVKFWEGVSGAIGLLPEEITQRFIGGGFNVEPLYEEVARAINKHIKHEPDAKYLCVNPRAKNPQIGGSLVD
jgi:hypothetical protein